MILSNQRYCPICDEDVYSTHRHDCKRCSCGNVMVDGGMEYLRHSGTGHSRCIVITDELCAALIEAVSDQTRNDLGKVCNIARVLRDKAGLNISNV